MVIYSMISSQHAANTFTIVNSKVLTTTAGEIHEVNCKPFVSFSKFLETFSEGQMNIPLPCKLKKSGDGRFKNSPKRCRWNLKTCANEILSNS